jgi:hypothetical protein
VNELLKLLPAILLLLQDDEFTAALKATKEKTKLLLERLKPVLPTKEDGTPYTDEEISAYADVVEASALRLKQRAEDDGA